MTNHKFALLVVFESSQFFFKLLFDVVTFIFVVVLAIKRLALHLIVRY